MPDILDYIVDFVRDEPQTLKIPYLVAKSWVSSARKPLLSKTKTTSLTQLGAGWKVFPDPGSLPGYHAHSLVLRSVKLISLKVHGCKMVRQGPAVFERRTIGDMGQWEYPAPPSLTSHGFSNPGSL